MPERCLDIGHGEIRIFPDDFLVGVAPIVKALDGLHWDARASDDPGVAKHVLRALNLADLLSRALPKLRYRFLDLGDDRPE